MVTRSVRGRNLGLQSTNHRSDLKCKCRLCILKMQVPARRVFEAYGICDFFGTCFYLFTENRIALTINESMNLSYDLIFKKKFYRNWFSNSLLKLDVLNHLIGFDNDLQSNHFADFWKLSDLSHFNHKFS